MGKIDGFYNMKEKSAGRFRPWNESKTSRNSIPLYL